MFDHKYRVGEIVEFLPARVMSSRTTGPCEIIRLLSVDSDIPQYRVKCPEEGFERVVRESELSERAVEAAQKS